MITPEFIRDSLKSFESFSNDKDLIAESLRSLAVALKEKPEVDPFDEKSIKAVIDLALEKADNKKVREVMKKHMKSIDAPDAVAKSEERLESIINGTSALEEFVAALINKTMRRLITACLAAVISEKMIEGLSEGILNSKPKPN